MKKLITVCLAFTTLIACNSNGGKEGGGDKKGDDITQNPDYQKGLDLVAQKNCLQCHKVDEAFTGPSYSEVATRYAGANDATIDSLAHKIIAGGTGVWGQAFMIPHPDITPDEAKAMVKYILLLKK